MRIEYAENPLASKVFLDESEKKLLYWKQCMQDVEHNLFDIQYDINNHENLKKIYTKHKDEKNLARIEKITDKPIEEIGSILSNFLDKVLDFKYDESKIKGLIDELQMVHSGDCTSNAGTCYKCYAEDLLEIESIPNYKGHSADGCFLSMAFFNKKTNKSDLSIEEAMENIKKNTYAYEYLEYYKKEILKK